MLGFYIHGNRFGPKSLLAVVCIAVIAILPSSALPQSIGPANSASVHGLITDSQNKPLDGVIVRLRSVANSEIASMITAAEGQYVFSALHPGEYTVEAEKSGYSSALAGKVSLAQSQAMQVDLRLAPSSTANAGGAAQAKTEEPQFFDEPKFTVAGVTDVSHYGGHGSDAVLRSSESLAKDAASLSAGTSQSAPLPPALGSNAVPLDSATEASLRQEAHTSGAYQANLKFGKLLVEQGKYRDALSYLEKASHLVPAETSPTERADLDHLLATAQEELGDPLRAVQQYQHAAELDASERNLFDWAEELLLHRAFAPAIEVFTKGTQRFPQSVRMRLGLGVSWYAHGSYDEAARTLCRASDLNPKDPNPYIFMGRMQAARDVPSDCFSERLARFASLQPNNALGNYYYAVSLWKSRTRADEMETVTRAEAMLHKSLELDPGFAAAYLQLGILASDRKDFPQAISYYQRSVELQPQDDEAHYRLAQVYGRIGEKSIAQQELRTYEKIKNEQQAETERDRREMRQFVYSLKVPPAETQP